MSSHPGDICTRRLAPGGSLKVHNAAGCTVMCCAGTVWITQESDARDIVLTAGESFTFDRQGLALIRAEEGIKDEWMRDTGITVISLPEKLLRHESRPEGCDEPAIFAPEDRPSTPRWSVAGLAQGVRLSVTAMPVMAVFGAAFGTVAAQKGLTLFEATLMSALMFAGASQFVATEIWTDPMTIASIITLGLVTATVNMRFVLMTASLRPSLGSLPPWQTYPAVSLLTEPGWLIALRDRPQDGADALIVLGSGFALWLVWIAATVPGYLLGALVTDTKRFGLDLVMPVFFIVMLVPLWRGPRQALPWAAAGAIALLTAELVAGWWYIIAGAVAGSIAGGLLDERA